MKLWPTRTKATQNIGPVADLDAIISEPVPFRFKGRIHYLKPMQLDEFLKFSNAQSTLIAALNATAEDDKEKRLSGKRLAGMYHAIVASVCDTITLDDILSMEQAQVAALYQLVIDLVTGQVDPTGEGKKKRQKLNLYESALPLSSPNAPVNLGGQLNER